MNHTGSFVSQNSEPAPLLLCVQLGKDSCSPFLLLPILSSPVKLQQVTELILYTALTKRYQLKILWSEIEDSTRLFQQHSCRLQNPHVYSHQQVNHVLIGKPLHTN
uniref:Uncharacterized protein n=1 Tax=Coturnix japonica TaxID=93934 RepID=A0A8C2SUI0_COTJA